MNGAQAMIRTLANCGVEVCFTNPGTSEMHFVAALDDVPEVRAVLALFEGVASGAADGYARIAGKPAATLLHLGPGLSNGWANLHNAKRGHVPVVNIVGDHATYHKQYDAPLNSDIEGLAAAVSGWVHTSTDSTELAEDTARAVAASQGPPGQVATLILPADVSWSGAPGPAEPQPVPGAIGPDADVVSTVAGILREEANVALLVGGRVLSSEAGLVAAARVAEAGNAKLLAETFPARLRRGAGLPPLDRLGYLAEFMELQLSGVQHLIVVDTTSPVSFFAYPEKPSDLVPDGCTVTVLAAGPVDPIVALDAVADALGAPEEVARQVATRPARPEGPLTAETLAQALGAVLPADAIVSDEGNTSGLFVSGATAGCPAHDWLTLTGGAIGQGTPVATGAAIAAPDRPVICLQAEGSLMYTLQALWTQAREGLDVTTLVLNNRSYAILNLELARVGATEPGPIAQSMLDLSHPELDFVSLAQGMGVPASRATDAADLCRLIEEAVAEPGPHVIEVVLPPLM